jgi:SAM-dependent methyltransferase
MRADLYDTVFRAKDYGGEAEHLHALIAERAPAARSLLDVACGTGRHLEHLAAWYEIEGVDSDPAMLERARDRVPGIPLHLSDMRDFDLDRTFDVVTCLFSAIAAMTTLDDLHQAIGTMARHLTPGGLLVVEPWISPETHPPAGGPWIEVIEEPERKIVVMETSTLRDGVWVEDEHVLVWTPAGIEHVTTRAESGAFTRDDHLEAFRAAGLDVEHDEAGLIGRGLFLGHQS